VILSVTRRQQAFAAAVIRFGPDGALWQRDLQAQRRGPLLGPMVDDRNMAVTLFLQEGKRNRAVFLDIETGIVHPIGKDPEDDIVPAASPLRGWLPRPGSPGARLFIREWSELVFLDDGGAMQPIRVQKH